MSTEHRLIHRTLSGREIVIVNDQFQSESDEWAYDHDLAERERMDVDENLYHLPVAEYRALVTVADAARLVLRHFRSALRAPGESFEEDERLLALVLAHYDATRGEQP